MTQSISKFRKTSPYPGDVHIDELNAALVAVGTTYYGTTDPATITNIDVQPGFRWADTSDATDPVVKVRNDTNDDWVVTGGLFVPSIDAWLVAPTVDLGRPIHIIGEGPAEWNSTVGAYVPIGGGAKGGGADKVFYLNDQVITEDFTVPSGQNAMTAGLVTINAGVTVTISDGSAWKIV